MSLNKIQLVIFLFLTIDVIFHASIIHLLINIDKSVVALKDIYMNIIRNDIVQTVYWEKE